MRTYLRVTESAIHEFRGSLTVIDFITGQVGDENYASPAIKMRWAELEDVLGALQRNMGRTFLDEQEATHVLFSGSGGGFGIPQILRHEVLATLEGPSRPGGNIDDVPGPMPPGVAEMLGTYIYALRDPRTRTIFHVSKGVGDRVYSDVWAAMGASHPIKNGVKHASKAAKSAKADRIRDIYASGSAVEHFILRHYITPAKTASKAADAIEETVTDALSLMFEPGDIGGLTNAAGGYKPSPVRIMPIEELIRRYRTVPAPSIEGPFAVLVVNAAADPLLPKKEVYEAGRGWWRAGVDARGIKDLPMFFVAADVVRAVYRAESWEQRDGVWGFVGAADADLEARYVGTSLAGLKETRSGGKWNDDGWHPYL